MDEGGEWRGREGGTEGEGRQALLTGPWRRRGRKTEEGEMNVCDFLQQPV